jgi:hypothetical protein
MSTSNEFIIQLFRLHCRIENSLSTEANPIHNVNFTMLANHVLSGVLSCSNMCTETNFTTNNIMIYYQSLSVISSILEIFIVYTIVEFVF